MKKELKKIYDEAISVFEQPAKKLKSFVTKHKKIIIVGIIGYVVWQWLFEEEEEGAEDEDGCSKESLEDDVGFFPNRKLVLEEKIDIVEWTPGGGGGMGHGGLGGGNGEEGHIIL